MTDRYAAAADNMAASCRRHFRDTYIFLYNFTAFLKQSIVSISNVNIDRLYLKQ